jgi:hypothetical protein
MVFMREAVQLLGICEYTIFRNAFPLGLLSWWHSPPSCRGTPRGGCRCRITMGIDGQYAFLSSVDVVDVKAKKIVAQMKDEYGKPMQSEKLLEMAFSNGEACADREPFGEGLPGARADEPRRPRAGQPEVTVGRPCHSRWGVGSAALAWSVAVAAVSVVFEAGTARAADPDLDLQSVQAVCGWCHTPKLFLDQPRSWDCWNDVFADITKRGRKPNRRATGAGDAVSMSSRGCSVSATTWPWPSSPAAASAIRQHRPTARGGRRGSLVSYKMSLERRHVSLTR